MKRTNFSTTSGAKLPIDRQRKGSAYVLIIAVSMLAAAITIAATLAARVQARAVDTSTNAADARLYAQAAIDLGRLYISQNSNWRTTRSNGAWFSNRGVGNGAMALDVLNPDGVLNRSDTDPILLTGTGTCGSCVQKIQVAITPQIKPYSCLSTSMTARGNINFGKASVTCSGAPIATNGNVLDFDGDVTGNVEATGTFGTKNNVIGTKTTGAAPRTIPSSAVFDYYTANGTTITLGGAGDKLDRGVLAPGVNTIGGNGATSSRGIYIVDCLGKNVTVSNARICATVVFLNCDELSINNDTSWAPAISTLPSLLVNGDIRFNQDASPLSELTTLINFNPSGAPYPWPSGNSDALILDSYPATVTGLIYASGKVNIPQPSTIGMIVCGGTVTCGDKPVTFTYTKNYIENPPPGFYDVDMTPSMATWMQSTN